jgi:hypothetical protein
MTSLSPAVELATRVAYAPEDTNLQITTITIEEHDGSTRSVLLCIIGDFSTVLRPREAALLVVTLAEERAAMTDDERESMDMLMQVLIEVLDGIGFGKGMH